jgi:hypothetical protein
MCEHRKWTTVVRLVRGEEECHGGAIARSEVRGAIHQPSCANLNLRGASMKIGATENSTTDIDVCRVAGRDGRRGRWRRRRRRR